MTQESFKMTGIARVTGWWEGDFNRRLDVVHDLLSGDRFFLRHVGLAHTSVEELEGLRLERETMRILADYGIVPAHEAVCANQFVNSGLQLLLDLLIGASASVYNNANAALGAGDSSAAFNLTQTNLQGAVNVTNRVRKAMNATFPSRSGQVLTFQSNFATTDANFVWNEWAAFNNVTDGSGTMLNRGVSNLGTKTSAQGWTLTGTITPS